MSFRVAAVRHLPSVVNHRSSPSMKTLFAAALLFIVTSLPSHADEPERALPFTVRSSRGCEATFTGFIPSEEKGGLGTAITIRDANRRVLLRDRDTLYFDRAVNAGWSPSGEYLLFAVVNGAGHFPYRHAIYIYSLRDSRLRILRPPAFAVFTSGMITFPAPNRLRLTAGYYLRYPADSLKHPRSLTYDLTRITERQPIMH